MKSHNSNQPTVFGRLRKAVTWHHGVAAAVTAAVIGVSAVGATSTLEEASGGSGLTMSGRAYVVAAQASLNGRSLLRLAPVPDTHPVVTNDTTSVHTPCISIPSGALVAHLLCATVDTDAELGQSTATAGVADATVGLSTLPRITLKAAQAISSTTCEGSVGSTTIAYLKVGTTVIINQTTTIKPNTRVTVGPISLVLNEQLGSLDARDLTVNAVHIAVHAAGVAAADVIIGSAQSAVSNCG